jgi:exodeoxyribonuclease VII large subunit
MAVFIPEIAYIKLSDLTTRIRQTILEKFGEQSYWVLAEISGHKFYPDRDRHYFDLVEKIDHSSTEAAKVKGNSWEQGSRQIAAFEKITGQKFQDGLQVLACVKVNYHIVYGLSLTLLDLDPNFTLGNLERLRKETLEKLLVDNPDCIHQVEGQYVTRNKLLKLNCVLQRIALIGSPKSEGYTDFVHTMDHNQFGYKVIIDFYYSAVQGVSAEQELVKTLLQVYEKSKMITYDCVVITRGGGARTDFLVFDTYALSRVVARFPIPVITGIGHHKDVSIVDMMAHTQTKTPTKAAEFILAHNRSFEEQLLRHQHHILIKTQQVLADRIRGMQGIKDNFLQVVPSLLSKRRDEVVSAKQVIQHKPLSILNQRNTALVKLQQAVINCSREIVHRKEVILNQVYQRVVSRPKEIGVQRSGELNTLVKFIQLYSNRSLNNQKTFLQHQQSIVRMMSPANILKKGFAIVSKNEKIITKSASIQTGDEITITLDGSNIESTVTGKTESHGKFDI